MRKSLVRLLIASALILPAPLLAQDAGGSGPVPISLDDAVRQAQANSPQTVQAVGASRVANANYKSAIASFLPSISFSQYAGHQQGLYYQGGILIPSPGNWGYNQSYGAQLTLFNGGQNWLDYRSARAALNAADQSQIIQKFTIGFSVKQQYFAVLAAREAVAAANEQLDEAQKQMLVTEARVAGGAMSRADSLSSAVTLGQAKVALATAQGNLVTANTALTRLVGADHEVTAVAADTGMVPTISLDSTALVQLALKGPAVRQAESMVNSNRSAWWASVAAYLPSLGMSYGSGSSWSSPRFVLGGGTKQTSTSLSFYVSYSLFNGFSRESRVISADVNSENAKAQLRDARLAARENIAQYLAQFRTAQTKIELQQLSIESSEQNVAAKDAQYTAGAASLVDVITAQAQLATARQGLIQARLDARTAKAQIEALIGKDIQ
jgi:outer membrane protein TolC